MQPWQQVLSKLEHMMDSEDFEKPVDNTKKPCFAIRRDPAIHFDYFWGANQCVTNKAAHNVQISEEENNIIFEYIVVNRLDHSTASVNLLKARFPIVCSLLKNDPDTTTSHFKKMLRRYQLAKNNSNNKHHLPSDTIPKSAKLSEKIYEILETLKTPITRRRLFSTSKQTALIAKARQLLIIF